MIKAIIAVGVLIVSSGSGFAQAPPNVTIDTKSGTVRVLRVDRPFTSALVGNSDIIDARPLGDRALVLTAKDKAGRTNLILLDNMNQTTYSADVVVTQLEPAYRRVVKFHVREGELNDYIPYACSPEDCVGLNVEQPGQYSNDIYVPGLSQPGTGPNIFIGR
jgi:hypothetical protein